MKLSIIIPCYNEVDTLARVAQKVSAIPLPEGWESEVIIVDDRSTDGTTDIASDLAGGAVRTITLDENKGKGGAVKEGLRTAAGDYILIQDADEEYDPADITKLLVATSTADSVFGSRNLGTNNVPYSSAFFYGGLMMSRVFNALFGTKLSDIATCYKLFPRRFIPDLLAIDHNDFAFDAVHLTRVLAQGGSIIEVPISYTARSKSSGKKLDIHEGLRIAIALIFARMGLQSARYVRFAMQTLRFLVSGGTAALVHVSLLYVLTEYARIWYVYSSVLAFFVAFAVSFSLQKYWVFRSAEHAKIPRQLPLHLGTALVNLGLNTALLLVFVEYLGIWYIAAQILASAMVAIESFLVFRWIFR